MAAAIVLQPPWCPPPNTAQTAISQHAVRQVYVIKTRKYYCFYYLLAILRHKALSMRRACVFVGCVSRRRWEYHTLSGRRWEYDVLSMHWEYGYSHHWHWEHHTLSTTHWEYDTLNAAWLWYYDISSGYKKNNNRRYWQSLINNFGQQCLNGAANWSAAEGDQVLSQYQHIVSEASMPPCTMVAVF